MKRVVIGVDGSRFSNYAVKYARKLLAPAQDVRVYLVHVVPLYSLFVEGVFEPEMAAPVEFREAYEERAEQIIEKTQALLAGSSLEVKSIICDGDVVSEIIRVTEEVEAELLVVGSRGLGQVQSMFLGSVSHKLVQRAKCPVLVVRDKKLEQEAREELEEENCNK